MVKPRCSWDALNARALARPLLPHEPTLDHPASVDTYAAEVAPESSVLPNAPPATGRHSGA
ncbi:MAG TPA: hypothetical protein VKD23_08740 [Terriglobales bacterium]|nr:hypothetical protein [Terriglobales bacterium]